MKHYYFKFGKQNYLFRKYADKNGLNKGDIVPLSIYFGKWNVSDFRKNTSLFRKYTSKKTHLTNNQIKVFINICAKNLNTTRFWIFFDNYIYVLKPISKLANGPKDYIDVSGSLPKTINSRIIDIFPKELLPEFFATINSNQRYNRKTIEQFKGKEAVYCTHLLKHGLNKNIIVNRNEALEYLSPIQFETLIFLTFHHLNIFCSTYRGGTLKEIDLKIYIKLNDSIKGFGGKGLYNIQVKMYDYLKVNPKYRLTGNNYLVHLGENDFCRHLLGVDWIFGYINHLPEVKKWLRNSLPNFDIL